MNVLCDDGNVTCDNENVSSSADVNRKRKRAHDASSKLWHCRLGHISRGRIERLVKNDILPPLEFSDLEQCKERIKGNDMKLKDGRRSRGRLLDWSLIPNWAQGLVGPLIRVLIGGAQPTMAGGPLSHCAINRGGGRRLKSQGLPEPSSPPKSLNPNPI